MRLPALMLILVAALAGIDIVWAIMGHFRLDVPAYARLGLLALALLGGARIYQAVRPDPRLAAMLFGTGFLCAFSLGASVLNYFLLTKAGPRIDMPLAALDRAFGFDWPQAVAWMAAHPVLNMIAYGAYSSMLPQVAVLTVALATVDPPRVYRFTASVAVGALSCIAVWALAPSFGAFSIYPNPAPHAAMALDSRYAAELVELLKTGPGVISPAQAKGLIGFPSYHAVLALLVMWHAQKLKHLRWLAIGLNLAVLIATPIQGGHHLMDVLGAIPVTAIAICLTWKWQKRNVSAKTVVTVNNPPKLTLKPAILQAFCFDVAQNEESETPAIKRKLSGLI